MNKLKKLNFYYFRWISVVISIFSFSLIFSNHFLKCIDKITSQVVYYRASQVFFSEAFKDMYVLKPATLGFIGFVFIGISLLLMFSISFKLIGDKRNVSLIITSISLILTLLGCLFIILIPSLVNKANPAFANLYSVKLSTHLLLIVIASIINALLLAFNLFVELWPTKD